MDTLALFMIICGAYTAGTLHDKADMEKGVMPRFYAAILMFVLGWILNL